MIKFKFLFLASLLSFHSFAQQAYDFDIEIESFTITDLAGIHSYSFGIAGSGKWLIVGGRTDGLHQRQPFSSFLENDNNKNAIIVDIENQRTYSTDLRVLPSAISEQIQSTNQVFYQRDNTLYVIGGYGFSSTVNDHITYPSIIAIDVNGLVDAIINQNSILSYFRQIQDSRFAITGGQIGYLDSTFYLMGGQYFKGRYNPMGPGHGQGFIQKYSNQIKTFKLEDDGTKLAVYDYQSITDTINLHRRDFNASPQIFPNGNKGFTMFSGVFQYDADIPYLNSVDVYKNTYSVNQVFNQYLSQYHSAKLPIYNEETNTMHTIFFGGISRYTLDSLGNLVDDTDVPFVNTISKVSRLKDGQMIEEKIGEMPSLIGSGSEFIPVPDHSLWLDDILYLNAIKDKKVLVGYIFGGIESSQPNIFFINNGTQSNANSTIFKVYLSKSKTSITNQKLTSKSIYNLSVFPNPANNNFKISFFNPDPTETISIQLFDMQGKSIQNLFESKLPIGKQSLHFNHSFEAGNYILKLMDSHHVIVEIVNIQE